MSQLWREQRMADGQGIASVHCVPTSNVGDCGYAFRRYAKTASYVVSIDVACNEPEVRGVMRSALSG
jgi:hypothetical protein